MTISSSPPILSSMGVPLPAHYSEGEFAAATHAQTEERSSAHLNGHSPGILSRWRESHNNQLTFEASNKVRGRGKRLSTIG